MFKVLGALALIALLPACAIPARSPLMGGIYTDVKAGLTATPQQGGKSGQACATSILGIVATGDASIEAARKNGGITSVAHVDEHMTGILGIYAEHCTIVHGK